MPPSCSRNTRALARDAQLAGDRVQTEYYLQFADHYFRVLSESRARFDEQNQQHRRPRDEDLDEDEGDDELETAEAEAQSEEREERDERQDRGERSNRRNRPRRGDGEERAAREDADDEQHVNGETIPFDALPPAIGRDDSETVEEEEPRRPRRRTRAPRPPEGDDEVAPAA